MINHLKHSGLLKINSYYAEGHLIYTGKCVRIIATILGHGAMAAQRTLNPLIQVRILVPRPFITEALNTQEEINPDRYNTRRHTGGLLWVDRVFIFNQLAASRGGLFKGQNEDSFR